MKAGKAFKIVGIIILIFIAIITVTENIYTVNTGEVAIISRFGKVSDIKREGIHFKIPFVESKHKMETREYLYLFVKNSEYGDTSLEVSTRDIQSINIEFSVQASVSDPITLYKAFNGNHFSRFIKPRVQEIVQSAISKYTIEEFISKRTEISKLIFDDLKDDFETYGLSVSNVSIVNHDFSDDYERAVEQKKVAEQAVEKEKAEQQKLTVEAENRVKLAELKLKEKELEAKGNKLLSDSLSDVIIRKMFIEKWNGQLPKFSGGGNFIIDNIFDDEKTPTEKPGGTSSENKNKGNN
ncbi:MAG: prohibitin family protein [Tissierellia bacterium]|nr:prohibitin family protein [Tissierellia bacterium]